MNCKLNEVYGRIVLSPSRSYWTLTSGTGHEEIRTLSYYLNMNRIDVILLLVKKLFLKEFLTFFARIIIINLWLNIFLIKLLALLSVLFCTTNTPNTESVKNNIYATAISLQRCFLEDINLLKEMATNPLLLSLMCNYTKIWHDSNFLYCIRCIDCTSYWHASWTIAHNYIISRL